MLIIKLKGLPGAICPFLFVGVELGAWLALWGRIYFGSCRIDKLMLKTVISISDALFKVIFP